MLQVYSIRDRAFNDYEWGIFTFDTVKRQGTIDFNRDNVNHYYEMPLKQEIFVRQGIFHLNEEKTREYIADMVQPAERPTSAWLMKELGEPDFNPLAIYISINGETTTDCTYLVRIK